MLFLSRFRRPAKQSATAHILDALITQSRQPVFFLVAGVPDTTEGRFELLLLHLFIVLEAVRNQPATEALQQQLFDAAFRHLDWNLREIGIGDASMGKKIKCMAEIFYGRVTQYRTALATGPAALANLLTVTLYPEHLPRPDPAMVAILAAYVVQAVAALTAQTEVVRGTGEIAFPAIMLATGQV
jgi:cytochrome b pre-mRNA-processing protein 3